MASQNTYSFSGTIKNLLSPFSKLTKPATPTTTPNSLFQTANVPNPLAIPTRPTLASPSARTFSPQAVPQVAAPAITASPAAPITPAAPPVAPAAPVTPVAPVSGTLETPVPTAQAPSTPAMPTLSPEIQRAVTLAESAYQKSQQISPDELSTQEDIDKLIESSQSAYRNIQDQPIPLEFITGQLASVERRALGLAEPLERKMARLQSVRTASVESSKFALERSDKALEVERKRVETESKVPEGFTLGEKQVRYDAKGNVVARNVGSEGLEGGFGGSGYVRGANPTVDSWVDYINGGKATISNVPEKLKNAVINALTAGGATSNQAKVEILQDKINDIGALIGHRGISKVVGPAGLARWTPFKVDTWTGDVQEFVGKVHQLASKETLDFLLQLKAAGGTLGALNEKELATLEQSATAINDWEVKDAQGNGIGKWNISETKFKKELEVLQTLAVRALQRATGDISLGTEPEDGGFSGTTSSGMRYTVTP